MLHFSRPFFNKVLTVVEKVKPKPKPKRKLRMSIQLARLSPHDLIMYKNCKDVWTKIASLQKLWKDTKAPLLKREVKKNVIQLINTKFNGVEKHCVFLGVLSVPYTLSRIRKELEAVMTSILVKYDLESSTVVLPKEENSSLTFLADDLDIYFEKKQNKKE